MATLQRRAATVRRRGRPSCALIAASLLATRAVSSLAADDEGDLKPATLTQEWIGIELTPVAIALPDPPCCRAGSVSTFHAGPGANLRVGRHRWQYAYTTPVTIGLFGSTVGTQSVFFHMQTEAGLIVPGTNRRLEIGLGLGFGVLSMAYSVECDGTCALGGIGWLVSLAARCLIIDRPKWTMGVDVRGVYPQPDMGGGIFGSYVGSGKMVFTGLEFGFGRS